MNFCSNNGRFEPQKILGSPIFMGVLPLANNTGKINDGGVLLDLLDAVDRGDTAALVLLDLLSTLWITKFCWSDCGCKMAPAT